MNFKPKCANCGACIPKNEYQKISFCPYCGTPFEKTENHIDELQLKLEHEEKMLLHRAKIKAEEERDKDREFWKAILFLFGMAIFFFIMAFAMK